MYRHWTTILLPTIFILIAAACVPILPPSMDGEGTVPAGTVPSEQEGQAQDRQEDEAVEMQEMTMYIAPEQIDCVGVAPMKCLQVKFEEAAEYEFFYDGIDGFVFVPGYNYTLRVQRSVVDNPPADASKYRYRLIEVLGRSPAYTGDTVTFEGTTWILVAFGDEDIVRYDPGVAAITANFDAGSVYGSAGCNDYSASYTLADATLTLSPAVATRMACTDEAVMAAENAYLQALGSIDDFAIEGNILTLTYAAGQLTFVATER